MASFTRVERLNERLYAANPQSGRSSTRLAGELHSAQQLAKQGAILHSEIQVGYSHIRAESLAEAIEIAKGNPEFQYGTTARVDVRSLKAEEESTGFVYPIG